MYEITHGLEVVAVLGASVVLALGVGIAWAAWRGGRGLVRWWGRRRG
jgi:hypothetical protein